VLVSQTEDEATHDLVSVKQPAQQRGEAVRAASQPDADDGDAARSQLTKACVTAAVQRTIATARY
jgi:hypothetical protein